MTVYSPAYAPRPEQIAPSAPRGYEATGLRGNWGRSMVVWWAESPCTAAVKAPTWGELAKGEAA